MVEKGVLISKSDINFVDKRAEQEWDAWMTLDSFHGYEKGWNGYDAEPLSDKLIYFVKNLIFELDIIPEIFPVADGSIQLEYDQDGKYLEFQIYEDKHMTWYYREGGMDQEGTCPEANSTLINQCPVPSVQAFLGKHLIGCCPAYGVEIGSTGYREIFRQQVMAYH